MFLETGRHSAVHCQLTGYVPQDDIVHSQLTVREALYFSTKLRTDLSDKEIEDKVTGLVKTGI